MRPVARRDAKRKLCSLLRPRYTGLRPELPLPYLSTNRTALPLKISSRL
jgi:hypothetical protein